MLGKRFVANLSLRFDLDSLAHGAGSMFSPEWRAVRRVLRLLTMAFTTNV
jgi:hypothetical protein